MFGYQMCHPHLIVDLAGVLLLRISYFPFSSLLFLRSDPFLCSFFFPYSFLSALNLFLLAPEQCVVVSWYLWRRRRLLRIFLRWQYSVPEAAYLSVFDELLDAAIVLSL